MLQRIIIALGAGVASAILFIVPVKGTMLSALFGVMAPLPLMIAFIGFGLIPGLAGTVAALILVALLLHPIVAAVYAAWVAVPVVCLCAAGMRRETSAGFLVACAAGLSVVLAIALVGVAILSYGTWAAAVNDVAQSLAPWFNDAIGGRALPDHLTTLDLARDVVRFAPALAAGWTTLTLCVNLWIAGRLALASKLLTRPWPNVPDTLRLPRLLGLVLPAAVGCSFLNGAPGVAGACAAAGLGAAFALQGLGALHAMTRGASARGAILAGAYAMVVGLMPWPLALAAGLGLVDCFAPLPRKPASLGTPRP
jgi:Predicted membrane protein (DUF2232)